MPLFGYYYDPTYILVLIGAVITMIASIRVKSTFSKFSKMTNHRGMTAEACAAELLRYAGIRDVRIERISGSLTDHYSPNEKILRLSDTVYGSTSLAALGVAAHECGHAIQHAVGYAPLKLRSASVPVANIGSWLSWPVLILGVLLGLTPLAQAGIVLFSFVVVFQLITLPVEFDASRRAMQLLEERCILSGDELTGASRMLRAAALTYVASLFSTLLQLLRLVLIVGRYTKRRD